MARAERRVAQAERDDQPSSATAQPPREKAPTSPAPRHRIPIRGGSDGQVALVAARRRAGRNRPDALSRPGHGVRLEPGGLRHEVLVLRHRSVGLHPPPQRRRDRRAGGGSAPGGRPVAGVQRRVHGHGRTDGQLRQRLGRHPPHPRRPRDLRAAPDTVHRRRDPRHTPHGRGGSAGEPGRVVARRQRRSAQPAGPPQSPLPACGAHGDLPPVRDRQGPPAQLRMGAHRRRQRPALRRARAGGAGSAARCPRQSHPSQSHTGLQGEGE